MRFRLAVILTAAILAAVPAIAAPIATIKNWTVNEYGGSQGFVVMASPSGPDLPGINITITSPLQSQGDFDTWMSESVNAFAGMMQLQIDAGPTKRTRGGVKEQIVKGHFQNGNKVTMILFGYEAGAQRRFIAVAFSSSLP